MYPSTWFVGSIRLCSCSISSGSAVFAGLTRVTNTHTHTHTVRQTDTQTTLRKNNAMFVVLAVRAKSRINRNGSGMYRRKQPKSRQKLPNHSWWNVLKMFLSFDTTLFKVSCRHSWMLFNFFSRFIFERSNHVNNVKYQLTIDCCNAIYTVSQKNDNDVAHYNFNAH